MNGRRCAAGLGLAAMMLAGAFATPAGADECPPIAPTCVVDTVDDVVDDTTDTVDDVVDYTTDTVDGVTDTAEDVVGEIVTTVDDTVGDPSDDPGPQEGGGGGTGSGGGRDDAEPRARPRGRAVPVDLPTSSVVLPEAGLVANPGPARSGGPATGTGSATLATGLALLSFLLAVVIGFVSFQHVLDRGDPKLAPETLAADLVPFA